MTYSIKLKDGHQYLFYSYRKLKKTITDEGVKVLTVELQYKPRGKYKKVRILPQTIQTSTLDEVRMMIINE